MISKNSLSRNVGSFAKGIVWCNEVNKKIIILTIHLEMLDWFHFRELISKIALLWLRGSSPTPGDISYIALF